MSVWYCIPSARPAAEVKPVVEAWHDMGYKVALWRDDKDHTMCDTTFTGHPYPGYASSVNQMAVSRLFCDDSCNWIVTGGDDTYPDPKKRADKIAQECEVHFEWQPQPIRGVHSTFGVMQPTGDRFAHGSIDRIAGSPWLGREWCLRANQGKGPFWPEFTHMFGDQLLQEHAQHLGVYWQRPDLNHLHRHFMRESDALDSRAVARPIPEHLKKWNTPEHWDEMKAIYERLRSGGFTECAPL